MIGWVKKSQDDVEKKNPHHSRAEFAKQQMKSQ